jgi:hypothetical protein
VHIDIPENKAVDKLAKEETEGSLWQLSNPHCTRKEDKPDVLQK